MIFNNIKHNTLIFLCILLTTYGCNNKNKKIIVENKVILETTKKPNKSPFINNISNHKKTQEEELTRDKKTLKETSENNNVIIKNSNKKNVIFEFRNERMLQGRNFPKNLDKKQTERALSAVLKMFKRNLSSNKTELNLKKNGNVSEFNGYFFEKNEISRYQNIIVFLPLTGKYSNFGNKIRKALDLSILKFNDDSKKIIYFDTGNRIDDEAVINLFESLKPKFIIGPFTREILLKIKPLAKERSLPVLTFSNDIAMIENNVWSLGFAPEEQIQSVISCALMHGYKKFGLIAPDNLYGKIIVRHSTDLISVNKNNFYDKVYLSNEQLNDKTKLYSILKNFLQFSDDEDNHTKFDTILLGGGKEFILEIAPLLAFFNVDSRFVKILGTEKFNNNEIKNEPSLVKSWYPIISSKNEQQFKFLWKDVWGGNINYFSNVGFDSGIIALNYLNSLNITSDNLEGPVTGFILDTNGYVEKPIEVMQVENLGKLTKIDRCSRFKD